MKLDKYNFKFGLGFIKELNKQNTVTRDGIKMSAGMENLLPNLMLGDVETLVDCLMAANKTETPRASVKDIEQIIEEADDVDTLFEEVFEALKDSNFTKKKTLQYLGTVKPVENK